MNPLSQLSGYSINANNHVKLYYDSVANRYTVVSILENQLRVESTSDRKEAEVDYDRIVNALRDISLPF